MKKTKKAWALTTRSGHPIYVTMRSVRADAWATAHEILSDDGDNAAVFKLKMRETGQRMKKFELREI